jgi:hypothetical protein
MSNIGHRLMISLKALRELGLRQLSLFALYQFGLRSGHYRRITPNPVAVEAFPLRPIQILPEGAKLANLLGDQELAALKAEADEIVGGKVRLFGSHPAPLNLTPPAPLHHWSRIKRGSPELGDLKFIWEPARFGWAFTLGRAFLLTQDETYPQAFWRFFESFQAANPPYQGPNWISGQEVALRLIAYIFAAQVFSTSLHTTPARLSRLSAAVAQHVARIPPTLVYARAQNNNHLISEALGLYCAAAALPDHPSAVGWYKLGWRWLNQAFQSQLTADGTYCQHSTNYHRLMLQAALWALAVQRTAFPAQPFPPKTVARLQAAVSWLLALLDPHSGQVPNLGPNDGAYLFPLSSNGFHDYRPVLQAAARAFLAQPTLGAGAWDEMSLWIGLPLDETANPATRRALRLAHPSQTVLRGAHNSWAYLRATHFTSRPGHADLLHLDLWWRGLNIALDAGTYRYTADPPWDNALSSALMHNTLTVDGLEPMTRSGRFLYLDWAQGQMLERTQAPDGSMESMTAAHNGYRRLGITHKRRVTAASRLALGSRPGF